jgi:phosphoserine phosphatase
MTARVMVSGKTKSCIAAIAIGLAVVLNVQPAAYAKGGGELTSWNDGPTKESIVKFVEAVTDKKSPEYVEPSKRIAVFDNDGTLWCEQPIYPQIVFVIAAAKAYVEKHPEVKDDPLFKAALSGDIAAMASIGPKGTQTLVNQTHGEMPITEFADIVLKWINESKHPRFQQPFNKCVYKPMLEVLQYFKKNGFTNYIVSGGGCEFMRPWTETTYDIPPEHVIGSTCKLAFSNADGKATVNRTLEIDFICDGDRKPVAIEKSIGRQPIAAFGNSNGDLQMLQWTTAGSGKRFALLVHHTDAEREYAYDRDSKVGRLDKALDEAIQKKWTIVDMKNDWKQIFPFQEK